MKSDNTVHYVLVRELSDIKKGENRNNQILGVYSSLGKLEDAYVIAHQKLKERHKRIKNKLDYIVKYEKIMIDVFDEFTNQWYYDVNPEQLFWRQDVNRSNEKIVECVIDSATMYMFKMEKLKKSLEGFVYEDRVPGVMQKEIETVSVRFDVEHPYKVFDLLDWYWGGWNSTPDAKTMEEKAKEWYEKYAAEVIRISHATLTFVCKKLSEKEAKELMEDVENLCAEIIGCKSEKRVEHLMEKGYFTLWWD